MQAEKFHALHLPLLFRKTFTDDDLTAFLFAGADAMVILAPHASIRVTPGSGETVEYALPGMRIAVQAGIGVQWQRTETMALTADLRYRSLTDDRMGGDLASIAFPAHLGLRIGLRVSLAPKTPR